MNVASSSQPVQALRKKVYGLLKLKVGADWMVRFPDGVKRQVQVKEVRLHPKAKACVRCFLCNRDWPSEEEMSAAHPPMDVMLRQEEAHVFAYWSEDPIPGYEREKDKNGKDLPIPPTKMIGLLSDEYVKT